jgi:hypothetical protein
MKKFIALAILLIIPVAVCSQSIGGYYGPSDPTAQITALNPSAWWRADDIPGEQGDNVTTWNSRANFHYATATSGYKPILYENCELNHRCVRPDGSNDYMTVSYGALTLFKDVGGATIIARHKSVSSPTEPQFLVFASTVSPSFVRSGLAVGYPSGQFFAGGRRLDDDASASWVSGGSVSTSNFVVNAAVLSYSDAKLYGYINGVDTYSNSSWLSAGNTSDTWSWLINICGYNKVQSFNGYITDILLWNRSLNPSEIYTVSSSLELYYASPTNYQFPNTYSLTELFYLSAYSGDDFGSGVGVGNISLATGNEIVWGTGTLEDGTGHLRAFDMDRNVLWTYTSPNTDYIMNLSIGDLDLDGINEIAVGLRIADHMGVVLDNNGSALWNYDAGEDNYVRVAEIGNVSASAGNEIIFAGRNGKIASLSSSGSVLWEKSLCTPSCVGNSLDTVQSVSIADIDSNGVNDIVVGYSTTVKVLDNNGTEMWSKNLCSSGSEVYGVVAGKITNNPGIQIAAVCGSDNGDSGVIFVLDSNANILFSDSLSISAWSVALINLDGGQLNQLVIGYGTHVVDPVPPLGSGGIYIYNPSASIINPAIHYVANYPLDSSVKFVKTGDVNNDGVLEILATCDDGKLHVFSATKL